MIFFSYSFIKFIIYFVSITFVQALPTTFAAGALESSTKVMKGLTNSKYIPKESTSSALESNRQASRLLQSTPTKGHIMDNGELSNPHRESMQGWKLELELYLARLNALKAEAESKTALANIAKVNELWKNIINQEDLISKKKAASRNLKWKTQGKSLNTLSPITNPLPVSNRQRRIELKESIPLQKIESELVLTNFYTKKAESDLRIANTRKKLNELQQFLR